MHRHYWRVVDFSEIAELYASRALRILAYSMVSMFVAVYLYQNGYDITYILLYFALYYLVRSVSALLFAHVVSAIGPKHAILASNIAYVPGILMIAAMPQYGIGILILGAIVQALSTALYDVAYYVDFSKVKHSDHSGKELGYMRIMEQIAKGISPVVGGFVAYWFGPQATLIVASVLYALAAMPLFFTPEPIGIHQKVTFKGLSLKDMRGGIAASFGIGVDYISTTVIWTLFAAIVVFGTNDNAVYAQLGVLTSMTIVVGIVVAKTFGILVDSHRANALLKAGVILDSFTHLIRIFVATPLSVLMVNILNEAATAAYLMPFTKGYFAKADDLAGYRSAYMSIIVCSMSVGSSLTCVLLAAVSLFVGEVETLKIGFVLAAAGIGLVMLHNFPALKERLFVVK